MKYLHIRQSNKPHRPSLSGKSSKFESTQQVRSEICTCFYLPVRNAMVHSSSHHAAPRPGHKTQLTGQARAHTHTHTHTHTRSTICVAHPSTSCLFANTEKAPSASGLQALLSNIQVLRSCPCLAPICHTVQKSYISMFTAADTKQRATSSASSLLTSSLTPQIFSLTQCPSVSRETQRRTDGCEFVHS